MLAQSFAFLPRVGEKTERRLWTRGIRSWAEYRAADRVKGVAPPLKRQHDAVLAVAEGALAGDPTFFAKVLPSAEHWRAFGEFARDAVYLDIETTGAVAGPNALTVFGAKRGDGPTRLLVRDRDLSIAAVDAALAGASMLVSFNGAAFDVPFLREWGATVPDVPHLDLLHPLRRLGFAGGLKKVERQAGLERPESVQDLSGWDAVLLWHRHELGDEEALALLLEYNRFDVEHLAPLARMAYDGLRREGFEAACAAGGARVERPLAA